MINQATDYVYITTPYLIIDYDLTEDIRNAALRGVDVRIVTPHIPDKKIDPNCYAWGLLGSDGCWCENL